MDFSVITIGQVQNVLSAMQKILECPICLDVVQEPVSTKCDHIFCRFCIFKHISKKKKGVVECPLCKTEVSKRSLKENSRFKQLIEGLLETIHAFELDTGVKFLKSHYFHKTSTDVTAAESLCKESSVIQSKGFRNRRKSAKGNGQENLTLQESSVNIQLTDAKMCRSRNKPQKSDSQKGIYIELGSESSEDFFKQASKTGFEDKVSVQISSQERLEELESAEKGNENSCNAQPDKLCAKETTLPNVIGESDFSKECLSKKSTQSIAECAKPDQVNVTECQSSALNILAVDLLPEQCDRTGDASHLSPVDGDTSFRKNTEEMDKQETQYNSESQEFDSEDSSESRLDKSKEMDADVQSMGAVEACEPENDSSHDNELPLEKLPQPETPQSATLNKISKKRLKQSIQKVNEWFSKSNEILSSSSSLDESAASADVSGEGELCLSDKGSCISEKTDPLADSTEIPAVEGKKRWSKQTVEDIKGKIFGKTYNNRRRKSNAPSTLRDVLPTRRKEDVAAEKCLNDFSKDRLKQKRKTACVLQPEDFIKKKKNTEEADRGPQSVNWGLGDAEKNRCDESVSVNESHLSQNKANKTLTELEEGGEPTCKKASDKVTTRHCDGEPEMDNCDQKSTKKRSSAAKRCKHSSRNMCALQLVVDRSSVFRDPAEPQIDSYPSSGEPRKADSEQNPVRRSRRLRILSEEMTKETRKGVKGARKKNSDCGRSVSGDQRNVATRSAECKDLCEPQDELSYRPVTDLEGGDLEANEMQVSLKNLSDTAETGRSLFNPSCQPSNCGSTVPDTCSQDSEILGSPLLLQLPSVSGGKTTSHQTEEVTESPTAFSQECGHDSQNVPGDLKTEKLPMAENVLELTKEAEDSDLDTQYLRNIFRHSKRSSFSLFQTARQAHAVKDPPPETSNPSCAAQVENKGGKQVQLESLQEEKAAAQNLSRVSEKEKTCESAHVDPVPCFAVSTREHRDDILQAAEERTLTPAGAGTAQTEHKNGLLQEEQGNEKPVSNEIGIEKLRQNPIKSNGSQSDQSNTDDDSRQNDVNTGQEISFSSEINQAGKTEVADCKGPVLHFQSPSIICPATCQQSPAEISCEVTETKSSKVVVPVKGNEEQAAHTVSTAVPKCSAAEEEPLGENRDLTDLSETPNGLLCSDTDIEENSSLCETDRKEQSAVFVKSGNALGKELLKRNASSRPRSGGIQKSRRRVQKLPSSDEESCEDEDLPCFQTLIFSKSASTPLQTGKQMSSVAEPSVAECPVSPSVLPHSVSNDNIVQEVPEAALSNVCVSPSQESECSVSLFSSQSNMSEEPLNGAQELKKHLPHVSKQMSSVNNSKETSQNCSGGLKTTKDECQEFPDIGANLGEASGYDSEISVVEDSCGPFSQGEILTTQQKNAMQNSLRKLQREMAVLEAALKQNGSQSCEVLPVHRELPHSSTEGALETDQMREGKNRSPELVLSSSKSSSTKRSDLEKGPECDSVLKKETPSEKTKPVQEAVQEHRQCQLEEENSKEKKSGTRQHSASVSSLSGNVTQCPDNSSCSVRLFTPQAAEATDEPVVAQNTDKSCGPGHKLKTSECFPVPVLHNATGEKNDTSPVVTKRKEMSIVASGLNHSEHLVVQKFVKKTQSTLSNHITEGTTHVIMKTDEELVCERTLKYFLGIAGGKWVVSYQWIIQSFKEGRILDEENFEVRGDVINGRNHQGPKRARQALTEKIFKGFEICCCGPFTGMTTEHLEWMVELCGASVVKQPDLFTHTANSTAVVVVQPDAWKEDLDYRAIHQQSNVAVVTREWVLDSVACYECQEFSAYLLS
ncbi:breast cancer type 1 susceptibility protein isoform X2 [Parus major]|uniref:breast cancer type 1 susceptibility protein isoform X2 n=1 Tax=Parus major TaxID=9157 RepID=UPI0007713EC2|nr:breast cancer type 1 susceptibility protein isoform X2 [Parus major]XP_015506656.1 breast cancer type 1 susceptibility protein isoform X2 [Parus major]XP_015506657.1 breast cancer type 1 susceptibility protein isoform X2 [Parus major]XP_015506658.1 breast cancer type 1 susceptibility protein isoform X2 [Parus major]